MSLTYLDDVAYDKDGATLSRIQDRNNKLHLGSLIEVQRFSYGTALSCAAEEFSAGLLGNHVRHRAYERAFVIGGAVLGWALLDSDFDTNLALKVMDRVDEADVYNLLEASSSNKRTDTETIIRMAVDALDTTGQGVARPLQTISEALIPRIDNDTPYSAASARYGLGFGAVLLDHVYSSAIDQRIEQMFW